MFLSSPPALVLGGAFETIPLAVTCSGDSVAEVICEFIAIRGP